MRTRHNRAWDLLVLGGGTAGLVGAQTAAQLGARVALVERHRTGGDCLWTGCVPSKALLAAAAAAVGPATALGTTSRGLDVDFDAVMAHVARAIRTIEPVDSPEALEQAGVTVLHGTASLTGRSTVDVDGREQRFKQLLVATGSSPVVPTVPGLRESKPLTSETVWDLKKLPVRLVVMGGGSIGCELGQGFARLGSKVTIVEAASRLLPGEDPDAAALVHAALEVDGATVLAGHHVVEVVGEPGGPGEVHLRNDEARSTVPFDRLLVTVGRRPRTQDLSLGRAHVRLDDDGFVIVDRRLRTTNPRVWAAGDVTPHPQLTHVAGVHASLAASNAVLGLRRRVDLSAIPRVTYTDPEVAAVGASSWSEDDTRPRTVTRDHGKVDRAVAQGRTDGFSRLVLGPRHRVIGATVVGPRAGESLAEITLVVRLGLTTSDLTGTMHPYPTYGDGLWNAAIADTQARLASPPVRLLTRALTIARRWWVRS